MPLRIFGTSPSSSTTLKINIENLAKIYFTKGTLQSSLSFSFPSFSNPTVGDTHLVLEESLPRVSRGFVS